MRQTKPEAHEYEPREFSPISLVSELIQQGTERFFATQRILLDLIMRQNSMTMDAVRQALTVKRPAPEQTFAELAIEGLSNFIAGTRVLLHFVRQHNQIMMHGVRERVDRSAVVSALTDIMRRSVDTFIELQEKDFTLAARQTEAWLESIRTGEPYEGKALPEIAKEALENFVHAQKAYLDVIAEETITAADRPAHYKRMEQTEVSELAINATHNFVDAQKKLLDVAAKMVALNLKTVRTAVEAVPAVPRINFKRLTRDTIVSFVDAQKALIDAMISPRRAPVRHEPMPREVKRAVKRVKKEVRRVRKAVEEVTA
jgi:hypothetical protein